MQLIVVSSSFTSDGAGAVSGTLEFGDDTRNGILIDAFVVLGTATGYSALTIDDGDSKDILNGAGAAAQTADKVYSWNATGGTAVNIQKAAGSLTVAAAGAGNAKTLTIGVCIAR